ncbi:MAG: hypothetical protein AAF581_01840 [Planctomycetota bacterium]
MSQQLGRTADSDQLAGTRCAFELAGERNPAGLRETRFRFAGMPVRMHVVGPALHDILARAFASLIDREEVVATAADSLVIRAWDRAHTGVGCPGIPRAPDRTDVLGPGLMSQYDGGRVLRYDRATITKTIDRTSNEIFICVEDAEKLRLNDRTKPFPHFLATWYFDRGVQLLHAGLVSKNGQGVLIGGTGGSGKSTTSIACALAGFDFLGDDTVGTVIREDGCFGYACYNAVRSAARNIEWFPDLQAASHLLPATPDDKGKVLTYMSEVSSVSTVPGVAIAGIVVPTVIGSGPTEIATAPGGVTLRKLAPSTLLRGLGGGTTGFAHMAQLTRVLPCFALTLGDSVRDVPRVVGQLLEDLAQ